MKNDYSDVVAEAILGLIVLAVLATACWQAFQGDWLPAIFFAVLWSGMKSYRTRS